MKDELYAIISVDNPLSEQAQVTMEELKDQELIISNNLMSIHDIVEAGFDRYGLRPRIAYELNNPPLTEQLLEENRGIAFMPGLEVDPLPLNRPDCYRRVPVAEHPFPLFPWNFKAPGTIPAPGSGAAGAVSGGLVFRFRPLRSG